ncbi:sugar 3,4-ketoisomerase [endosymbiont of Ridgeia piscesae]|jgi:dTDP-4-dehydrorhamnose 3,5-epimerase-like enzyme|uniref:WxcM-like, C-terminal n=1 Tax=endosymbiont of Ridgeia piscesae TaxID=54398 RepID=A0A0T5YYV0_9GAMM|nr:FdtA/QdtA family cupin domain-containing protein [endosymbiont of Ridgeia piscesae]KRT55828.1 WxcM-like, C-terminal [endosymbiont of Ridgeia piscesae]KRT57092.1 WxcM-like, C-terminal [endosymbiont of Ridgeia piscesae]
MENDEVKFSSGLLELDVKGGNDGYLVPLEERSEVVPFSIRRVYYIYGVGDGLRRGFHAHKTLKQLIVCVSGQCTIDLDNACQRESFRLNQPNVGLLINEPVWREMYDFSDDCVLMVLASEHYDPNDYIQSFREFKAFVRRMPGPSDRV